jgi:ketosteroid isomerase-like protein
MKHPNLENIEKAYAAFAEGDIATIMELWTDDIVWHTAGNHPLAGDHAGKDAVAAYLGGVVQTTGGTFRAELQHALADDTNGYSLHKGTGTKDGEELEGWSILGYRFRDGKVDEIWTFDYDQRITDRLLG